MTDEEFSGWVAFPVEKIAKPLMITRVGGVERPTDALANETEIRRAVREV